MTEEVEDLQPHVLTVDIDGVTYQQFETESLAEAEEMRKIINAQLRGNKKWVDLGDALVNTATIRAVNFHVKPSTKVAQTINTCPADVNEFPSEGKACIKNAVEEELSKRKWFGK